MRPEDASVRLSLVSALRQTDGHRRRKGDAAPSHLFRQSQVGALELQRLLPLPSFLWLEVCGEVAALVLASRTVTPWRVPVLATFELMGVFKLL